MNKKVLLVIAQSGFQPDEYGEPKKILEEAGVRVFTASNKTGKADSGYNDISTEVDIALSDVLVSNYDGIFFIGGGGALGYLDNEGSYKIIKEVANSNKIWGAICISPRILAKAGVLSGKKVTGWNEDEELENILKNAEAEYIKKGVVIDNNLITADGPSSAKEFGEKILELLK